jgi:tripartite ATP-independent transporter DctM subunit
MLRYGYDARIATGVIAASGTITQLIPPSLVLIVLADQLGKPVGEMYAGAIGPSIVQVLLFCAFIFFVSLVTPERVPALPKEARTLGGPALMKRVLWGIVPSLVLIFLVLGTILAGIATSTEGGAMGAMGAIALAAMHRRLSWPLLWQGMSSTLRITAMVIFILIGSTVFTLVFRGMDGDLWIERLLTALPGGAVGFLIAVNVFIFVLAFFLDFFEIAFIVIPLLAPVAAKLGIDLIWFGVLLGANMQTSFMHPPFGFALFYLRGVAPRTVKSSDIYWGAVPWVVMQLLLVAILIFWPGLVTDFVPKAEVVDPAKIEIELENAPAPSEPTIDAPKPAAPSPERPRDDAAAEIERMLKHRR